MSAPKTLPDRSTGWKKGMVNLRISGETLPVRGLIKYGYGISRGESPKTAIRLTQVHTGSFVFWGSTGLCKRLAEALHEHVPAFEDFGPGRNLTSGEIDTVRELVRLAQEEDRD